MTRVYRTTFQIVALLFLFTLTLTILWPDKIFASGPGDLDIHFNNTGIVTTSISSGQDVADSVAIQADGKIVVAGTAGDFGSRNIAVARYQSNGRLDPTFGKQGIVTTSLSSGYDSGHAVAIQPDGKIVVAGERGSFGNSEIVVIRYTADGDLDAGFNGSGIVTIGVDNNASGASVAIQADGKIVVAGNDGGLGNVNVILIRYNPNGVLDATFNSDGLVTTSIGDFAAGNSVAIQADGKIVVAGSGGPKFAVFRYNSNGSLDNTFNVTGIVTTSISNFATSGASIAIQNDGKMVVAGNSWIDDFGDSDLAVVRYTKTGKLDSTFNQTGIVHTAIGNRDERLGLALQPDDKIVVTSLSGSAIAVVRYNQAGQLDTTFNGGIVTTPIENGDNFAQGRAMAIQADGKIVVAGSTGSDFAVVRYLGDPPPVLHLEKTVDDAAPPPNKLVAYTITISNSGLGTATGVVVTDALDSNTNFASASDGGVHQAGVVTWPVDTIPPNQAITRTLQVTVGQVISGTILTNTAWVASDQGATATDLVQARAVTIPVTPSNVSLYLPLILKD